jgi:hypothetical protein
MKLRHALLIVPLIACAHRAEGQINLAPADCDAAAAAVAGLPLPAADDSTFAPWFALATCGTIGEAAFAQAIQTAPVYTEADGDRLAAFFGMFYARRTSVLFNALKSAVQTAAASDAFQLEAIRALGGIYAPGTEFDSISVATAPRGICGQRRAIIYPSGSLADLPSDYLVQMVAAMQSVETAANRSMAVRGNAHCWRLTAEFAVPPVASKLFLTYMCGNRFRYRNTNTAPAVISTDVYGTSEHYSFTVQPAEDYFFELQHRGTVRLFFNGSLIQTKANGGTTCH